MKTIALIFTTVAASFGASNAQIYKSEATKIANKALPAVMATTISSVFARGVESQFFKDGQANQMLVISELPDYMSYSSFQLRLNILANDEKWKLENNYRKLGDSNYTVIFSTSLDNGMKVYMFFVLQIAKHELLLTITG